MGRLVSIWAESLRSAKSQPIASAAILIVIAGMCALVLLTNGRAIAAERAVLASIDDAGTRAIIVRAEPDSGLDSTVLARLAHVEGIAWMGGFGPASDVQNAAFAGGESAPLRVLWTNDFSEIGATMDRAAAGQAWLSSSSLDLLGLAEPVGAVRDASGASFPVVGALRPPDYLSFLDPLAVAPRTPDERGPVSVLVVLADRPDLVAPLSAVVQSALGVSNPAKAKLDTSAQLAELRALVQGQLGDSGRSLVLVVLAASGVLVFAVLYGLVMLKRKDFGRRRALGASQHFIVTMLLLQVTSVAAIGTVAGSLVAMGVLVAVGDQLPTATYALALAVLAVLIALVASATPAVIAARRDPHRELRVP